MRKKRVSIEMFEKLILKNHIVVTGFPGFGYTGYIATRYLAKEKKLDRVGVILTSRLPEYTVLEDYGVVFPFEIFSDHKKLTVIVNHVLPDKRDRQDFALALVEWLKRNEISELALIGGLDKRFRKENERYRWFATTSYSRRLDSPLMEKGLYIIGPLAYTIMYAELYKVPSIVILPYTEPLQFDPRAAATAVEVLDELYGLDVDTRKLYEDAERLEKEISELVKKQEEAAKHTTGERVYM